MAMPNEEHRYPAGASTPARPFFLISIDTEGDNLWGHPREITTRNAAYLARFQQLCESCGFKPTYLTNYEMACSPEFVTFGQDLLRRKAGEIGMHLHAWNSPPLVPLTPDDHRYLPYLSEYPHAVIRDKVRYMTGLLEDTFAQKMVSHRAGRWGFNEAYAESLVDNGYCVDCSVTPHVSWRHTPGDPAQTGGPDYTSFPDAAYFLDLADISCHGTSPLLEVPMTIRPVPAYRRLHMCAAHFRHGSFTRRVFNRFWPSAHWFQPNRRNRRVLLRMLETALAERWHYLQFTLHSSEFMPGGSPTFRTPRDIEQLYTALTELFIAAKGKVTPVTLCEFHAHILGECCPCPE